MQFSLDWRDVIRTSQLNVEINFAEKAHHNISLNLLQQNTELF